MKVNEVKENKDDTTAIQKQPESQDLLGSKKKKKIVTNSAAAKSFIALKLPKFKVY